MKSKMLALILAALFLLGGLAGCGAGGSSSSSSPSSSAGSGDSSAAVSTPEPTPEGPSKYDLAYAKYDPDDVVLTVNGTEVTWDEYYCWLFSICYQVEYQNAYYYNTETDWSQAIDEEHTYQSSVQEYAENMVSQYVIIDNAFNDSGLTLSDDAQAELDNALQNAADNNAGGDLDAFIEQLNNFFISEDYYLYTSKVSQYYNALLAEQFGADAELLSDEDAIAYAVDNGYMYAKHILFKTVDDAGTALDEETIAQKKADAEAVLAQLRACATTEEMLALFDTLEAEYNEDTGREYYPDGYYFLEGEMVTSFEDAVKALEENGISDVVESDYGYHIILRPAMDPDAVMLIDSTGAPRTLRYVAASEIFAGVTSEWFDSAEIVYTDKFASLDLNELFAAE